MSKKMSRLAWACAIAALACALVYFNLPAVSPSAAAADDPAAPDLSAFVSDAPPGHEVGQQLPDFTLTTLDGEPFTLSQHRGKVTVLNIWATWCTPCVRELPYFDRLLADHPGEVAVLAIHSDLITDDPAAYLAGFDYQMPFAVDEGGRTLARMGVSTMLPQTLVLDAYGVVTYNKVGSVTPEALEELFQDARSAEPPA